MSTEPPAHPNELRPQQPSRFPITRVGADLKQLGIRVVEAGVQGMILAGGDQGALSGLISAIADAAGTVHIERGADELGWELVRNALVRATADLYDEGEAARPKAQGDVDHLRSQIEIALDDEAAVIPHTVFKDPGTISVVRSAREHFKSWLRLIDLNPAEAESLANRLPTYFTFAFHEEWRARRDHYQPFYEHYETPVTAAVQMEWDWERNRRELIKRIDEPVFEETFSLRQVYVPLRAYWREEREEKEHGRGPSYALHVVDLHQAIDEWLRSPDKSDAVRLVSGGPGSGKSSFAKKLAADLAESGRMRVLYFPLQRFPPKLNLEAAIERYLTGSGAFAQSPVPDAVHGDSDPLLLIFDGLDELTKPGDVADEMTRQFVQEVRQSLGIWNTHRRRFLVLMTGRTVVAQAHRHGLGLTEHQRLAVLPYLVEEDGREELERSEAGDFDAHEKLEVDQRQGWWAKYAEVKGLTDKAFPAVFDDNHGIKN